MSDPTITDRAAAEIIQCARAKVVHLRPYFAKTVYGVNFIENSACPSMGIDEYWRCSYNPEWVKRLGIEATTTAVLEKILHRVREHGERFTALGVTMSTLDAAQAAACAEIQDDLAAEISERRDLAAIPEEISILPQDFGLRPNDIAENYYMALADRQRSSVAYAHVRSSGKQAGGAVDSPAYNRELAAWKRASQCRCGSGATGVPMPWEHARPEEGGPFGLEEADRRDLLRTTAKDIVAYAQRKGMGSGAGSLVEWAKATLRPKRIPWEQLVGGAIRRSLTLVAGCAIHSYQRPSRRQAIFPDFVMPGMRRPIPHVAIVGDTSSSMSAGENSDLALVRGCVEEVCRSNGARVSFIACDAEVHGGVQRVSAGSQVVLAGRGGTDMRVGIHAAMTRINPRPDLVMCITDCGTAWPDSPLPAPTKLLILGVGVPESWQREIPKWATFVNVDPRQKDDEP